MSEFQEGYLRALAEIKSVLLAGDPHLGSPFVSKQFVQQEIENLRLERTSYDKLMEEKTNVLWLCEV